MNKENTFEDLIDFMFLQAEKYLLDLKEFFPFASAINSKKEIISIGIFDDDINFDANKAIEVFSVEISKRIAEGELLLASIAINGYVKSEDKDVILLRFTNNGLEWHERYFTYYFSKNKVVIDKVGN